MVSCRGGSRIHASVSVQVIVPILDELWLLNGECIDGNITCAHFVHDFTLDNFMDNNSKRWNVDLVRQVFRANITSTLTELPTSCVLTI